MFKYILFLLRQKGINTTCTLQFLVLYHLTMEKIMQEKISADHLLYVSLKYAKTTDVILNLLSRWRSMIEISVDNLLEQAKKRRKIAKIPDAPKLKIDEMRKLFKKNEDVLSALDLYDFFKHAANAERTIENEFRKHVTLKVFDKGQWISIDLEKLKEYAAVVERFISQVKQLLVK